MPFSRLNYRHLYYFWMVAAEGNLTRVAERLHVSQSALSTQIRQLEEQMGHALFLRESRALKLTEMGHLVLDYAENIFAMGSELIETIAAGTGHASQCLRVGGVATLSRNFQENFLRPAMGLENVKLVLESGTLQELLGRLAVHKLDVVLSNRPVGASQDQAWRCRRIAKQPVCLIGRPRATRKAFRFPEDMHGMKLLLPGHSSDIRTEFDMLCEAQHIKVDIFAEVDDMAMLRLLTRDSGGVALAPAVVVQDELKAGTLEQYCLVPDLYENFYAITTERRFQPKVLDTLLAQGAL
jgi:LysR family transcriptional activator of nhaA